MGDFSVLVAILNCTSSRNYHKSSPAGRKHQKGAGMELYYRQVAENKFIASIIIATDDDGNNTYQIIGEGTTKDEAIEQAEERINQVGIEALIKGDRNVTLS